MIWAQLLAYVTGTVNQELLLRNEYLTAENRILKAQIKGRLLLSQEEKATLAEIAHRHSSFNAQSLQACERGTKEKRSVRSNLFATFQSHPRQILRRVPKTESDTACKSRMTGKPEVIG
jgi:hypothetical protein